MTTMVTDSNRKFGIDLLRCLAMLMIVCLHVLVHGGMVAGATNGTIQKSILSLGVVLVYCGVNIFAMISGYVGVNAKHRLSSFFQLYCLVWFYSVALYLISLVFLLEQFNWSLHEFLLYVFPITMKTYWYFTAYALLWFIMPLLNQGIGCVEHNINSKYSLLFFFLAATILPLFSLDNALRLSSWLV